ncbi:XapX domain-containing protein [Anoxybacter fermentans]|uniref:XapX domain-containing protein n=1 Tax=Anoxybacter fermentans TaxID=1323375 RepID=A0A3Q9HRD7_9FIRM|nr:DUF1427 family protein [Anoxybacter fermentans]AZR74052.1 XapX domain-containing protein [Anoxybacter fermentans]
MKDILLSTFTGMVVGVIFTVFKLPLPAPPTLASVMGVVGIFLGYILVKFLFHM